MVASEGPAVPSAQGSIARRRTVTHADVVVVGGGPGGATAGAYLAMAGRDVVVVEKESFPRVKVCGDGLTPRAVQELTELGLVDEAEARVVGWRRNRGLRVHGGGITMELPWPRLDDWPDYGLSCTREQFDATLARHAVKHGAQLWEGTEVTGATFRDGSTRVNGVTWRDGEGREGEIRAPIVIAADGASSRLMTGLGVTRRKDRPLGVAVRTYHRSPLAEDEWMSSFLELRAGDGTLLPGYGWLFPMDDGTVNIGCGLLNTSPNFQRVNYRELLASWTASMPPHWDLGPETRDGRILSAALPMGFARTPLHWNGILLVGDAGGMVNPFNGEGISYAMESAKIAAEVCDAALDARSTAVLDRYVDEMRRRHGGYYTLGRWFVKLIAMPEVMRICTTYGMPHPTLMVFVLKLMAQLTDERPSDRMDAVINTLQRAAPAA